MNTKTILIVSLVLVVGGLVASSIYKKHQTEQAINEAKKTQEEKKNFTILDLWRVFTGESQTTDPAADTAENINVDSETLPVDDGSGGGYA